MIEGYTKNQSVQILIALLKKHGIKKVIISPGTTNLEFTAGIQYDGSFEIYSAIDERGAAYMACGMTTESKEPVVITCTEATASRNYFSALTEAYYRKLPILAVTGVHRYSQIGHLIPQVIDRSISPVDMFVEKVQLPVIKDAEDVWQTTIEINSAILKLKSKETGPVHIDLPCCNDEYDFYTKKLPEVKMINRYYRGDIMPSLPVGKIAIFIGSHYRFTEQETILIDNFCKANNAVVFCDHTSGYNGKYAVHASLVSVQNNSYEIFDNIELLIHIGEHTGDGATMGKLKKAKAVWRISCDGELRDTFHKLEAVFQMHEKEFFEYYGSLCATETDEYLKECREVINRVRGIKVEYPFSNIFVASIMAPKFPESSIVHLGVSNTIRAWSLFEFPDSVYSYSNVGCRGIDGALSTCIGGAMINREQIHYCILGDLSFFYDMNAIGNRDIGDNLRILLINNGGGHVFKHENAPGFKYFGNQVTGEYIAASGHFGNKSKTLVKDYALNLGFDYLVATNKESFVEHVDKFLNPNITKSMIFEIFTEDVDETEAFHIVENIEISNVGKAKQFAKQILGNKGQKIVKDILK